MVFVGLSIGATHEASALINVEMVTVRDAGNVGNVVPGRGTFGAVDYVYRIGKFEVTIAQYCAFLNAVAATDIYDLYHPNMASDQKVAGIARSGSPGSYTYSVIGPSGTNPVGAQSPGNRPISYVSWSDAARFVNWLANGQPTGAQNSTTTENGAYNVLLFGVGFCPPKNATNPNTGAPPTFWIPSRNEWYKAAYYKGGGTNAGYWDYPTQSDDFPDNTIGAGSNQANVKKLLPLGEGGDSLYAVTQSVDSLDDQNYLTEVGAFSATPGPYGTFDMQGGVAELHDSGATARSDVEFIGAAWTSIPSSGRNDNAPNIGQPSTTALSTIGFRVAGAPPVGDPVMLVEQPAGTILADAAPAVPFVVLSGGAISAARVYTVRNTGAGDLTDINVSKSGEGAGDFTLTPPGASALSEGESTTFSVSFATATADTRTAQITITSNDTNNSPFIVNLSGVGLSQTNDTDTDGLNDAAEFTMSDLGFDWQTAQTNLVGTLYSNAPLAGLYTNDCTETGIYTQAEYDANRSNGQVDVITDPQSFGLFTQNDVGYSRYQGQLDVINNSQQFGLYDETSIMDLRMDGIMVRKESNNATVVFQPQSTTNLSVQPFTNNGTPITNTFEMPGNKGFMRIQAKPAPTPVLPP